MLGHKLVQVLGSRFEVWTTLRAEFAKYEHLKLFDKSKTFESVDVRNFENFEKILKKNKPDAVVNAAGIIKQKPTANDVAATLEVNSIFPQKLANCAERLNFRLITISTDCVFDGKRGNYSEDDTADAADLYGRSKNLGEVSGKNCLTLRTSIIGREIDTTHSLIEWFISNRGGQTEGFKRAIYTGFPTVILADIIGDIIETFPDLHGLYHLSSDSINKFDLLNLVNRAFRLGITIKANESFLIDRSLNSEKFRRETNFKTKKWAEMIKIMAEDAAPYEIWRKRSDK